MSLSNFRREYKDFTRDYVLPLMGIPRKPRQFIDVVEEKISMASDSHVIVLDEALGRLYFTNGKRAFFYIEYEGTLAADTVDLAENLCRAFFSVAPYYSDSFRERMPFYSNVHREKIYQLAVQRGISSWVVGGKNDSVEELLSILEKWSVQTYEGKRVTFGFVVSTKGTAKARLPKKDWFKFLKDDYSAVLTDCIHSVIRLDENCGFVDFLSLAKDSEIPLHSLSPYLPLRFSQCIDTHVCNGAVGIFLLNNGDIILSKDRQIKFVKRNLHWLNFSYEAFRAAACRGNNRWEETLLRELYATTLDISFAHTGGILSVVKKPEKLREQAPVSVLKPHDNLLCEPDKTQMSSLSKKDAEIAEVKRQILNLLINGERFPTMDRKLRSELAAMDGACILDPQGTVISFGAIIRSDAESSGGARGAASRTLSNYGMAIKISTDGYVELYLNREKVLEIK